MELRSVHENDEAPDLRSAVEDTLRPMMKHGEVHYDSDGDIPLTSEDGIRMYLRICDAAPFISVFSVIRFEAEVDHLLETINLFNASVPLGSAYRNDSGNVTVVTHLFAQPFAANMLRMTIQATEEGTKLLNRALASAAGRSATARNAQRPAPGYL